MTYPNDQTSAYSYLNDEHDFRLQTIHHKNPSAATLSKFDCTYDAVGNIMTWRQERAGSAAKIYTFGHDLVDQLTSAVLTDTNSTPTILKRQAWSYDVAGNRTVDQTDDAVFASTHNSLNRLDSRAPGGPIVFAGSLDEIGTGNDPTKGPDGFDWRSRNPNSKPGDKDGNFWNPKDKVSVRPDLDHAPPIGPHWDVHDRVNKKSWRQFPDGSFCPK